MFHLQTRTIKALHKMKPNFGFNGFGELVYYRTYSRQKPDGTQEKWVDTVIRVMEGIMTIREDYYKQRQLPWDRYKMLTYAHDMALSFFRLEWLPPGRGLWAMGTPLIDKRGAMPLYNCAYTEIGEDWVDDLCWIMDLLMFGVGVGFAPLRDDSITLQPPEGGVEYIIEDSREGWVDSVRCLLQCYLDGSTMPSFNYNFIRSQGQPLKTFGGTASGPGPLKELHKRVRATCERFMYQEIDSVIFKTDLSNQIAACVVAGNIRRSAQIALGEVDDPVFKDLKNYKLYPERAEWGWLSNNSTRLSEPSDFNQLGSLAHRAINNSDVGILNLCNTPYGRIGDPNYIIDVGTGVNPCGEIVLSNREVCNLACTVPTRCATDDDWYQACEYATFYASTITLLPTHQESTNAIVAKNRRIGIDIIGFTDWMAEHKTHEIINYLRTGYKRVKMFNQRLAHGAGIPESIRVTTIKPGGTVSKLVGRSPGAHHPSYTYLIRRIRIQKGTRLDRLMQDARIPFQPCVNQPDYTHVFEYPVHSGYARPMSDVSIWEQAMNLVLLQREWADNSVSNTLYFKKNEEEDVERVLSSIVPVTKSISMMPLIEDDQTHYAQMPEEQITQQEYNRRLSAIKPIDWSSFRGDGIDEKYCTAEGCSI